MTFLQFADKSVPYGVFVKDDYVSQRKAFEMFGRRNVERWRRQGKVNPCKRPGKVEYRTADLRLLQRTQQDYLDPSK